MRNGRMWIYGAIFLAIGIIEALSVGILAASEVSFNTAPIAEQRTQDSQTDIGCCLDCICAKDCNCNYAGECLVKSQPDSRGFAWVKDEATGAWRGYASPAMKQPPMPGAVRSSQKPVQNLTRNVVHTTRQCDGNTCRDVLFPDTPPVRKSGSGCSSCQDSGSGGGGYGLWGQRDEPRRVFRVFGRLRPRNWFGRFRGGGC